VVHTADAACRRSPGAIIGASPRSYMSLLNSIGVYGTVRAAPACHKPVAQALMSACQIIFTAAQGPGLPCARYEWPLLQCTAAHIRWQCPWRRTALLAGSLPPGALSAPAAAQLCKELNVGALRCAPCACPTLRTCWACYMWLYQKLLQCECLSSSGAVMLPQCPLQQARSPR
jgi:hypothetical protein